MTAIRTARERARAELTALITDEARRQLATEGAARLSLRAVARELGMASSALYRYFPSRDDLLTALIVDAYTSLADCVEHDEAQRAREDFGGRWLAACRAVCGWAREHPHEYALIYGSKVPGYRAPADTVAPFSRVPLLLVAVVRDAWQAGALAPLRDEPAPSPAAVANAATLAAAVGSDPLPAGYLIRAVVAWTQLVGTVSLEQFGHLRGAFADTEAFVDQGIGQMARFVGLPDPAEAPPP